MIPSGDDDFGVGQTMRRSQILHPRDTLSIYRNQALVRGPAPESLFFFLLAFVGARGNRCKKTGKVIVR